jgi:hypothetical protein
MSHGDPTAPTYTQQVITATTKSVEGTFRSKIVSLEAQRQGLQEVIAVLSTYFLDDNGNLTEEAASKDIPSRVLEQMRYCHAWVVCGPVPDAMDQLITGMRP